MSHVRFYCPGILVLLYCAAGVQAQGTYKLEVKPGLSPAATLSLEGNQVRRTPLKDDPGFRLQFTFKKDGKPLTTIQARGAERVDVPEKKPGTYAVVLEIFHPSYKSGNNQKGDFRPVSNELTYEVKASAKPGGPVQVVLLGNRPFAGAGRRLGQPAVVIQCGKGQGKEEKELLRPGYDYELLQGSRFDGWKPPAGKSHCWMDKDKVHFVLKVPTGVAGVLRLHAVDGGGSNIIIRTQQLSVEGKVVATQAVFHGPGIVELVDISAADTRDGKIDVIFLQTRSPPLTAVVSSVEFFPIEKAK